jgi:beta-lactamase regulating signal transducer with metallopeptidase domain
LDDSYGVASGGGSGGSSSSGSGGSSGDGSFFGAAAAATNSSAASSTTDSTSRKENSYLAIWISLLFLTLIITLVIWRFIKAGRENEVQYQNLDTTQILGKIAKK